MTIHERYPFVWRESRKKKDEVPAKKKDYLDEEVGVLCLQTRAYNALKRSAINTIRDLIQAQKSGRLFHVRNLGTTSIDEISIKLCKYLLDNER